MHEDDPALEQRLCRFEAQLDRFSLALRQWQETQEHAPSESTSDLNERIRALEETVSREATALRQIHEEPLRQLQAQAQSLGEVSRSLQALVADLRIGPGSPGPAQGTAASWPLERVVHLHDELRRTVGNAPHDGSLEAAAATPPPHHVHLLQAGHQEMSPRGTVGFSSRYVKAGAAAAAGIVLAILGFRWIEARLDEASARVAAAEHQVNITTQKANQE